MEQICLILLNVIVCGCLDTGSQSKKCDQYGKCTCKPGFAGVKFSACAAEFYLIHDNGQVKCIGNIILINMFEYIASSCKCVCLTFFTCKFFLAKV